MMRERKMSKNSTSNISDFYDDNLGGNDGETHN